MKLPSLNVDSKGDSYFTLVESADPSGKPREQDITYWQIWETLPDHYQDFKPSEEPRYLAILSGKLEITSSVGERRYFSRGDTLLLQDLRGKGHAIRTYGWEPCTVLRITMKQPMAATAG
jgi:hypothetical protein